MDLQQQLAALPSLRGQFGVQRPLTPSPPSSPTPPRPVPLPLTDLRAQYAALPPLNLNQVSIQNVSPAPALAPLPLPALPQLQYSVINHPPPLPQGPFQLTFALPPPEHPAVDIPPPPPIPNVPHPLPLTHQPFNPNWSVHYMGRMDVVCSDCEALHWTSEKLSTSLVGSPKFGMCCFSGKIKIPRLDNPPPELLHLLSGQEDMCKKFRDGIRNYNNALAMTSLGCDQDRAINRDGGGPYVFKIQGRLYHQSGSLLPRPGSSPVYAQLYIYDPQEALDFRMNNRANTSLHRATMQTLQDMLYHHHPGVQMYKQAFELTQHMGPDQQCKIALRFDGRTDQRQYNLPTDTSNKIAVILPGDGDQPTDGVRDIILNRRGGGLQEISGIPSITHSIMSCSFLLASFNGIWEFCITLWLKRKSLRLNFSNTVYFLASMNPITSS